MQLINPMRLPLAAPVVRALVMVRAQETLALNPHRQLEQAGKGRGNPVGTLFDQLFQDRLNRAILQSVYSCFSMVGFQLHGIPDWTALAGACPGKGSKTKLQTNFQTSRYTTPKVGL